MSGIIIIGAGMAGHRAVIGLRANGYDGAITLVGEEALMPYDRPPLSKSAILEEQEPLPVWLMDEGIAASLKADVRLKHTATAIDRKAKTVSLNDGSSLGYHKLLLATGAKPRRLPVPGGERAILLRNFEDALALRARFQPGARVVVVGGGFIGLELASSANKRGSKVTLIEAQPRILMRGVPEDIARIIHDRHAAAGVDLRMGQGIAEITETSVRLANGDEILFDAVIAGIGAAPEIRLAEAAGLALDNGIAVDGTLQTSDPDIFAAGDCCSFPHPLFGDVRIRLEAWRNAQDQGTLAGENMLGAGKIYKGIPWFWSDQYELNLQVSGLPHLGRRIIERKPSPESLILFHLTEEGRLVGASGIGPGNSIGRDIKLAEMLIARQAHPATELLADRAVQLKSLLK
ncbi:MAG: FAD-dependent oxidoreductase [Proteobacteria bacterium]|nr:FAD-dependent oxidoreductase [Pseudomonadota bacterium]